MKVQDGKLVYETKPCWCAEGERPGQVQEYRRCKYYDQKVKGRFPADHCPDCDATRQHSHLYSISTGQWKACDRCNGTLRLPEGRTDYMPQEIVAAIPLKVFRLNRGMTFNESLLGMGCLWSCQDYGRAWSSQDSVTLKHVQEELQNHSAQACAVVDEEDRLPQAIGIFVNIGGYSVRSLTPDRLAKMGLERDYETGMQAGIAVSNQGGHGTLAGVYKQEKAEPPVKT